MEDISNSDEGEDLIPPQISLKAWFCLLSIFSLVCYCIGFESLCCSPLYFWCIPGRVWVCLSDPQLKLVNLFIRLSLLTAFVPDNLNMGFKI